jgi:NDP-sugar pyrophosphorylase family protein
MASGNTVHMFPIHEYWLDIGRKEDFIKAQTAVLSMYGETNVYTGNYSRAQ